MVIPAQIDTCSEALLRESFAEAVRRDLPWQIHAAQSVVEVHEITRRHGKTPIGWLDHLGALSDRSSLSIPALRRGAACCFERMFTHLPLHFRSVQNV